MHVLNQTKNEKSATRVNKEQLSKSMLLSKTHDLSDATSNNDILRGIGANHKKEFEKTTQKDGTKANNRFQISTAHDWKTEVYQAPREDINAKDR